MLIQSILYFFTLGSGKDLKSAGRYITNGLNFDDSLEVSNDGLKFLTSDVE